jgi:hypothetical protein
MSDVVAPVTRPAEGEQTPPPRYPLSDRVRRAGYYLLVLQLVGFLVWSAILFSRFAVTSDFETYSQPWYLIAHGNLDPTLSIAGIPFWQNDSEFYPWLLAPLYWIGKSSLVLSWAQDLSIAGAEMVAFTWLSELARDGFRDKVAAWLTGFGLFLMLANPWIWWTVSFDVHEEAFVMVFLALLARDVYNGRRRAWLWAALVMLGGAPSASYVVGVGLGGIIAGRRSRRLGALITLASIGYSGFLVLIGGDLGVTLPKHYGYLAYLGGRSPDTLSLRAVVAGITAHPLNVLTVLWQKRFDIEANVLPSGLLGLALPALLPLMIVVLLANSLSYGFLFSEPLFQSLPLYILLPVGTVAVLGWIARRRPRAALVLGCLIAAQAIGWAVVWGPKTPSQWLRVPSAAAATLSTVQSEIPSSAEVIVSQGVAGRFSGRVHLYEFPPAGEPPLYGQTWFVITPQEGIQIQSLAQAFATIGELAGPLHAALVTHANGVWAFRLDPPPGMRSFTPPGNSSPLPAWAADATAGYPVLDGSVSSWHMAATGAPGYVSDGLEWLENPGNYQATVTLSASGPVNVEVWDDNTNTLLSRQSITPTDGIQQILLPVAAPRAANATVFGGWGPFRADFEAPPPGQRIEVRVWSPGGYAVNVYSAELTADAGSALSP